MYELEKDIRLQDLQVPRFNQRIFEMQAFKGATSGNICTCGHPETVHASGGCALDAFCGCSAFRLVASSLDVRTFFQITHGPMEAHALARGMSIANNLGIEVRLRISCGTKGCRNGNLGAARYKGVGKQAIYAASIGEIHRVYCFECFNDQVFDKLRTERCNAKNN